MNRGQAPVHVENASQAGRFRGRLVAFRGLLRPRKSRAGEAEVESGLSAQCGHPLKRWLARRWHGGFAL